MTTIYVAAAWAWREQAQELAKVLHQSGHRVTSRWLDEIHEIGAVGARDDLEDIDAADTLVLMTMPIGTMFSSGGRMVELGYAIARRKNIVLLGERENIFCHLPQVIECADRSSLLHVLGGTGL
jgi:nucleoside 2-deoxyribosyltransferase